MYSITAFINRFTSHSQDLQRKGDPLFQDMFQSHQTPFHPGSSPLEQAKIPPPNNSIQVPQLLQVPQVPQIQQSNVNINTNPQSNINNQGNSVLSDQLNSNLASLFNAKVDMDHLNSNEVLHKLQSDHQISSTQIV